MKILILDLLNLGDLVMASPAVRMVRRDYPDAEIHMLAPKPFIDTMRCNPNIDRVVAFEKGGRHERPAEFLKLALSLRRQRYDILLCLHDSARTLILSLLVGARERWGLVPKGYDCFFDRPMHLASGIHRVDAYLRMMEGLGFAPLNHPRLEMHVDAESEERVAKLWRQEGLDADRPVVGLSPGARVPQRSWPAEHFARLAGVLHEQGLASVLFGAPGERHLAERIMAGSSVNIASFVGELTVMELAAAARRCSVFVVGDTGPLHIAASQGTPVAALFGPSDPAIFHPYGVPHVICKSSEPCEGCKKHDNSLHTCLASLSVRTVADAVLSLAKIGSAES